MAAGDYLPSVRDLAVQVSINPNTIAKAYQTLQTLSLVESVRGTGIRVLPMKSKLMGLRKSALLDVAIDQLLMTSRQLGVTDEALLVCVGERLKSMRNPKRMGTE